MFLSLLKKDWLLFVVGFERFLGWFASVLIWGVYGLVIWGRGGGWMMGRVYGGTGGGRGVIDRGFVVLCSGREYITMQMILGSCDFVFS